VALPRPIDVLIVAAYPPELSTLSEAFGRHSISDTPILPEFAGKKGSVEVVGYAVGVGLVEAAIGTMRCLQFWRPRAVLLVATCGAYADRGFAVGDVVRARRVHLASSENVEGRGAVPSIVPTERSADPALTARLDARGIREADVATTLAVTTDAALGARIASAYECDVEHLEAFAVASACAALDVPFAAVLAVANRVGPTGRQEWLTHRRAAENQAASVALRWLELGFD
jgi:nucleoside phosphorylase